MFGAFYTNALCVGCPLGMYSNKYGMTTCATCPAGTYANTTGNAECTACAAGFDTNALTGYEVCQKVRAWLNVLLTRAVFI